VGLNGRTDREPDDDKGEHAREDGRNVNGTGRRTGLPALGTLMETPVS